MEFLVDTGATICTLEEGMIPEINVNNKERRQVKGVGGKISTRGVITLGLKIGQALLHQRFHILPKGQGIPKKGIIGLDLLMATQAVIDLQKEALRCRIAGREQEIPFKKTAGGVTLKIPPRCQMNCRLPVKTKGKVVIEPQQLSETVFLARTLTEAVEGQAMCLVINTGQEEVILRNCTVDATGVGRKETRQTRQCTERRWEKIQKELRIGHLPTGEQRLIKELCRKYHQIFQIEGDKLSVARIGKQKIKIKPGTIPVYKKPYRNPYHQKNIILEHIDKLKQDDIIEPSTSPWNSPLVLVPKKSKGPDGKRQYRVCIDYRGVNSVIEQDRYPLPNIQEIMDQLGKSKYYTCMDLSQGYYQVELEEDSRPITAFISPEGEHYQLTRMPMGLSTSPAAFSRLMTLAMAGIKGTRCLIYLDDLIVFSRTITEHIKNLEEVFKRLQQANLKIHPKKTHFLQEMVVFLGFQIDKHGIRVDPEKTKVIKEWPKPQGKKELQQFFGLANFYRQFIENFALKALPLSNMLKKGGNKEWTVECDAAFETLKKELCSNQVLDYPDFDKEFIIYTDASRDALGAVLQNANGRPVHYASRTLKDAESRYATVEKELLAIVFATKVFRPYLMGRKFTIRTDHAPLKWLFGMNDPSSRLTKFRLHLEEYDFSVEHVPGRQNAAADALSRIPMKLGKRANKEMDKLSAIFASEEPAQLLVTTRAQTKAHRDEVESAGVPMSKKPENTWRVRFNTQVRHIQINERRKEVTINPKWDGARLIKEWQRPIDTVAIMKKEREEAATLLKAAKAINVKVLVIPGVIELTSKQDKQRAITEAHEYPTAGHAGVGRTYATMRRQYYWPSMHRDICERIKNCPDCRRMKKLTEPKIPQTLTETPGEPFEKIYLDLVGPIDPVSKTGNMYILVIKDDFSKYIVVTPLKRKTAEKVAQAFVKEWILKFGTPLKVVTDRGTEFRGITEEVFSSLRINHAKSTPFHHQTVGSLENSNKTLANFLRIYAKERVTWDEWLPFFAFAFNSTVNCTTTYTPFEILFGRLCRRPTAQQTKSREPPQSYAAYVDKLAYALRTTYKSVRTAMTHMKTSNLQRTNIQAQDRKLAVGDEVYLKRGNRKKMDAVMDGPFEVIRVNNPNVTVRLGKEEREVHQDNVSKA